MTRRFGVKTVCPECGADARLASSRTIGTLWVGETRQRHVVLERRVECPCAPPGHVYVVHRIELPRGLSPVWTVNLPGRRGRRRHNA